MYDVVHGGPCGVTPTVADSSPAWSATPQITEPAARAGAQIANDSEYGLGGT